ncbi:uncharacterized protein LOC105848540 isoform X2 [Hydra vulgaris]|uniref:Uncharacterized protein LOC105848540 isoform X2 n=1 Tax=Hydra vulgaris TaxID=6087 RepID=A0ABM4DAY1_HYDVU
MSKIWFLLFFLKRGLLQTLIDKVQREIIKNTYLGKATIYFQYEVSFEIYLTSTLNEWSNVILITNGNEYDDGSRIPSVFFTPSSNIAEICSSVNGNSHYCFYTKPLPLMEWTKVMIKQFLSYGNYFFSIEINDETVHSVQNSKISLFENVLVYVSDPSWSATPGYIRNLYILTPKADTYSFYRDLSDNATLSMSDVIKIAYTLIIGADAIVTYMDPSNEAYDADACIFTCLQNADCYSLSYSQVGNLCMLFNLNIRYNQNFFTSNIKWDSYLL